MLPFCVIKTSAELEAIKCTVSPLNSPACFVSLTAAILSNASSSHRIIACESDSQLVLVCYRVRDTSTVESSHGKLLPFQNNLTYLGMTLDRSLTFKDHILKLKNKVSFLVALIKRLAGLTWGCSFNVLRT